LKTRRTQYEIHWEILIICRSERTFTQIINRCDLNSKIAQEHIDFLSAKGYLSKTNDHGRTLYKTAESANEYLTLFAKIYQELYENSPEFKL